MTDSDANRDILSVLSRHPDGASLAAILRALDRSISRRTLQRRLRAFAEEGRIQVAGKGRAIRYQLVALREADADDYASYIPLSAESREIARYVTQPLGARQPVTYDRALLEAYQPNVTWYLDEVTRSKLRRLGETDHAGMPAGTYGRAILDRLLIDLSWSSSRLEGNTYTRLDTARLIEAGELAEGRDAQEAQMILNHKRAIELLVDDAAEIGFNRYTFLNLHGLLSDNLLPDPSASGRLRSRAVEIGQSVYLPTSVPQLIEESFDLILSKVDEVDDPFEQSFFLMVHIPYLQPFEDVNKRVARLGANVSLVKQNLCPLAFVEVPERAYIAAQLGVYELGRIELLRDLFIWAYERSTRLYIKVKRSLEQPDPLRLRYREQIYELVGEVVRQLRIDARDQVAAYAEQQIDEAERERFVAMVMDDLKRLHEGVIARYRLRPSEFARWQERLRGA